MDLAGQVTEYQVLQLHLLARIVDVDSNQLSFVVVP